MIGMASVHPATCKGAIVKDCVDDEGSTAALLYYGHALTDAVSWHIDQHTPR